MAQHVSLRSRLAFGAAGIPLGVIRTGIDFFLLFFYSQIIGLSPALAGLALAISLGFDAVSDPLTGYISDNWKSKKWGRRHPFMYVSIVPMALLYIAIWYPPFDANNQGALFAYLLITSILLRVSMTLFDIPSNALVPELTSDYDERTRVGSLKISSVWITSAVFSIMMYSIWLADTDEQATGVLNTGGYQEAGIVGGLIVLVTVLLSTVGLQHETSRLQTGKGITQIKARSVFDDLMRLIKNRSMRALLFSGLAFAAANGTSAAFWIYVFTSLYGLDSEQLSLLVFGELIGAVLAIWAVDKLATKGDKKSMAIKLLIFSACFNFLIAPSFLLGLLPAGGTNELLIVLIIRNVIDLATWIMLLSVMYSLFADVTENIQLDSGDREEGIILSGQTFINKSAAALGTLIAGTVLTIIQYPVQTDTVEITFDMQVRLGMSSALTWTIPCLIAAWCLTKYEISRESHKREVDVLAKKEA